MLFDEVFLATLKFPIYSIHVLYELMLIICQTGFIEPKRTMAHGDFMINFCTKSYLYSLYGFKHQTAQLGVENIQSYSILKLAVGFKGVYYLVCLHRTEILNETEIADLT